jgi:hypothetical protein
VEDGLCVRRHQIVARAILAVGIPAKEHDVEVPTVGRRVRETYSASEHQAPKPRPRWQAREGGGDETVKGGKAKIQALIDAPPLTRSFTERT